jgi:hypothetical protein
MPEKPRLARKRRPGPGGRPAPLLGYRFGYAVVNVMKA